MSKGIYIENKYKNGKNYEKERKSKAEQFEFASSYYRINENASNEKYRKDEEFQNLTIF